MAAPLRHLAIVPGFYRKNPVCDQTWPATGFTQVQKKKMVADLREKIATLPRQKVTRTTCPKSKETFMANPGGAKLKMEVGQRRKRDNSHGRTETAL